MHVPHHGETGFRFLQHVIGKNKKHEGAGEIKKYARVEPESGILQRLNDRYIGKQQGEIIYRQEHDHQRFERPGITVELVKVLHINGIEDAGDEEANLEDRDRFFAGQKRPVKESKKEKFNDRVYM